MPPSVAFLKQLYLIKARPARRGRDYPCSQTQIFGDEAKDRLPEGHICSLIDKVVKDLELGSAARANSETFLAACASVLRSNS